MGLRHVTEGERFTPSASLHNKTVDTIRGFDELRQRWGAGQSRDVYQPGVVPVLNDTGRTVPRFGIMAIEGVTFDPDDNESQFLASPVLKGVIPEVPDHFGWFVIALAPAEDGDIVDACIDGVVPVKVFFDNPYSHFYADLDHNNVNYLRSRTDGGAQILYAESNTGASEVWAFVRISPHPTRFVVFELKTALTASQHFASAFYREWDDVLNRDDTDYDYSRLINVWDYIGDREGTPYVAGTGGHRGAYGIAVKMPQEQFYRIIDLECPS